jgi:hypothetical protein
MVWSKTMICLIPWWNLYPNFEISSDDTVSAIGPKHFWKARRELSSKYPKLE